MAAYDVFISFRNTGDDGRPTRDAAMAESLYHALRKKGYHPFFSKLSIDNNGRADYMTVINDALETARILVAVGSSRSNLTSRWVKREINMFSALMMREKEGERVLLTYRSPDFPVDALPANLADLQSYEDERAVVRFIDAILNKASGFRNDGSFTQLLYGPAGVPKEEPLPPGAGLQIGSVLDGRYKILTLLGRGGMGSVYLAQDQHTNRYCAVKEIRRDSAMDFSVVTQSLDAEVGLMKQLHHPAIPALVDVIRTPDAYIVIMEHLEGKPLSSLISAKEPLPEEQIVNYGFQLAKVLGYLHTLPSPIIYRDMKPSNVIVHPDGMVKLVDFGTARQYKPAAPGDTTCLGTMGYAAPEQFGGMGQTDARTDIYALGATLYHLATGRSPAAPPYEMVPIRQIRPELSEGLELIIQKCTQKNRNQRFQTAKELLEALEDIPKFERKATWKSLFRFGAKEPQQTATPRLPEIPVPEPEDPQTIMLPHGPVPEPEIREPFETGMLLPPEGAPTLPAEAPAPKPAAPKPRKVTVRTKTPAAGDRELEELLAKVSALDPESRKLVRSLVDRLSQ